MRKAGEDYTLVFTTYGYADNYGTVTREQWVRPAPNDEGQVSPLVKWALGASTGASTSTGTDTGTGTGTSIDADMDASAGATVRASANARAGTGADAGMGTGASKRRTGVQGEESAGNGHGGDDDMAEDTPQDGVPGPSETDANATAGAAAEPNSERPKKKRKSRPKNVHHKRNNRR